MSRIPGYAGGPLIPGLSIYEDETSPRHNLGDRLDLGDGRIFHYVKAGAALAAGKLAHVALHTANHHNMAVATHAIGSKKLTVTLGATAATADMYKDGLLLIIAGTGIGQTYKVKGNPAAALSTTCEIELYDRIRVATSSADSKVDLLPNPFNGLKHSATEEYLHIGVPLCVIANGSYGWVQTWGICAVLGGDTAPHGTLLNASDAAGEVKTMAGYAKDLVGVAVGETHADGEYNAVFLRMIP